MASQIPVNSHLVNGHLFNAKAWPAVLEIPTGPPVRGRQLWRRTGNFSLIFLWFYVYDLRFKTWGPTTFLTEFPTLVTWTSADVLSVFLEGNSFVNVKCKMLSILSRPVSPWRSPAGMPLWSVAGLSTAMACVDCHTRASYSRTHMD